MKNIFSTVLILFLSIFASSTSVAQNFPRLDLSPMDAAVYPTDWKNNDKLVKVIYGRPQLKGRDFAKLAAVSDKGVWRTGANEAPEITFFKDVLFAGKKVKAGTYTLFTIPSEKEWTLILSSVRNVWGHYTYDEKQDVLRVEAAVVNSEKTIEAFSMLFSLNEFDVLTFYIGWGNTVVSVPISEIL